MKRLIAAAAFVLVGVTVAYGYTMTRRERLYRQLVIRGDYALVRSDSFAAVAAFSDAIVLRPDSMLGYLKRGEAYYRRGELDAAASDLERASALDPAATRALDLRGDVEAARQQPGRAADHYAAYTRLDERSPRVLYKLGLSRHRLGQYAEAADALTKAVTLDNRLPEAHYLLGVSLRALNRPREAQQALERAVFLAPGLVSAREQLADVYAATGNRAARIAQMEALFALDSRAPRHVALAVAHAQAGDTTRAVRMLRSASELYSDDAETYLALGRIWLDIARTSGDRIARSKAIEALHYAAALEPSSAAFALLGEARLDAADAPLAERTLRQATEKLPADKATFLQLADAAERSGHAQAARRALLDYHALTATDDPRRTEAARRIAELSMRLGESRAAATWYQRAADTGRPSSSLLLRLAEAQLHAGDAAGARKTVERIIDREPGHAAARAFEQKLRD